jgi:hypothetical protein
MPRYSYLLRRVACPWYLDADARLAAQNVCGRAGRLRKLSNLAQSEALTHITWTWTGSDYQMHDSIALYQDFA